MILTSLEESKQTPVHPPVKVFQLNLKKLIHLWQLN